MPFTISDRSAGARVAMVALGAALSLLLVSCAPAPEATDETPAAPAPAAGVDRAVLDDPTRPEEERAQDAHRKALEIYEWLGIGPGMTVGDIFASGGYNTHLLSRLVGDQGKVHAVMEFYADPSVFEGRVYKLPGLQERVETASLGNVEILIKLDELPAEGLDAMVVVRNYHDVEWVFESLKRTDVVAALHRALKPGGVIGIVEVATDREGWDEDTHRLNESMVVEDFTAGGFELEERSDLLANPDDDHSVSGFEQGRHTMDRYLLRFRKPA